MQSDCPWILKIVCILYVSVEALNVMFTSMNKPSSLDGWKADGGDPCDDDDEWKGIDCSGSSVTKM